MPGPHQLSVTSGQGGRGWAGPASASDGQGPAQITTGIIPQSSDINLITSNCYLLTSQLWPGLVSAQLGDLSLPPRMYGRQSD